MQEFGEAELRAVARVLKSKRLFRYGKGEGSACEDFEKRWAKLIGSPHALAVTSGTNALICGMAALGIGPGDEVIMPAYTFIGTAAAVLAVGAIPVVVNIDQTLTIDPKAVERAITRHTKAILPVHIDGFPCAMNKLVAIARRHGLFTVEDAAQASGGSFRGKRLGAWGDVGCFSFNQFKILTAGEGGALVMRDRALYEKAVIYHDIGAAFRVHTAEFSVPIVIGASMRISELTGVILAEQAKRLDAILKKLRRRKTILSEILGKNDRYKLRPVNDERGECATSLLLETSGLSESAVLVEQLGKLGLEAQVPLLWKNYFVRDWEPVLKKRASHHPRLNPFMLAKRKYDYNLRDYTSSVEILGSTVRLPVQIGLTEAETRSLGKRISGVL